MSSHPCIAACLLSATSAACAFAIPLGEAPQADSGPAIVVVEPDVVRDTDTGPEEEPPPPCEWSGVPSLPGADATDAYYRDPVRFRLTAVDPSASLQLRSPSGEVVGGSVAPRLDDPTVVELWPSAPLTPRAEYRATATWCDGRESTSWAFTVSAAGESLDCVLPGAAWQVDLATARWNTPAGLGGLVPHILENDVLISVLDDDDGRVASLAAPGVDGVQDVCTSTTALPTTERTGPDLTLAETTTSLQLGTATVTIAGWRMDATVLPDCSGWEGGRTRGQVDLRELTDVIRFDGATVGADGLCAFFATYDAPCVACADAEPYCLDFDVEGIRATAIVESLACVDLESCHPGCSTSTCDDPTAGECSAD